MFACIFYIYTSFLYKQHLISDQTRSVSKGHLPLLFALNWLSSQAGLTYTFVFPNLFVFVNMYIYKTSVFNVMLFIKLLFTKKSLHLNLLTNILISVCFNGGLVFDEPVWNWDVYIILVLWFLTDCTENEH